MAKMIRFSFMKGFYTGFYTTPAGVLPVPGFTCFAPVGVRKGGDKAASMDCWHMIFSATVEQEKHPESIVNTGSGELYVAKAAVCVKYCEKP